MREQDSPEASEPEQPPLFGIGEGYHGQTIRYLDPENTPDPYINPEKPKKLEDMTAEEMIWVAAHDGIVPDIYGHFDDRRGVFIRDHDWTPYSEGEATRAIGGGLVNYLLGAKTRGGLSAVRDVLDDVDRDRASAVVTVDTLRLVQNTETDEFNAEWARGNTHVRQALAKAIFARNSLNLFEWPRHYDRKTKETKENAKTAAMLTAITDKLTGLDDETMKHLLLKTLLHEQARLRFWSEQMETARTSDKTGDLVAAAKSRA
jgi:hypothetical protein